MMISPAGANDPYAAAAALDRQLRSSSSDPDDASSGSGVLESGPDVVVTLSKGSASAPSTYDASGRMSRSPGRDATTGASEPDGDDDDSSSDATSATSASAPSSAADDSSADEDAAVAA